MPTEFVMVPVPNERVQEVYRLLASASIASSDASGQSDAAAEDAKWTDAEIARAYRESQDRMKRFLDYLASVDGKHVTAEETAAAVGYSRHQQAGMLGAFGHRVNSRYGRSSWFFDCLWSEERQEWTYSMDADAAKVVLALKG